LVLDLPRSALLTIPDALPGLRDGRCSSSASPRHCGRARSPGSKYAKLCDTRMASSLISLAQARSGAARHEGRLPVGRTDLCPVKALDAWLAAAAITEGPLFRRIWPLPSPRRAKASG
jgi:hypothetical protein